MPPKGKRNRKKKETSHVEQVEVTTEETTVEATTSTDKDTEPVIDKAEDLNPSATTVDSNAQTEINENSSPGKADHRETETTATSTNSNTNNNSSSSASSLNDRLFALRMKINQSRKQNMDDVEEEYNRITGKRKNNNSGKSSNPDGEDETYERSSKKTAKAATRDEADVLQTTAEDAEWQADKRRRKAEIAATYGMSAFTSDANYRAYEKRVAKLTPTATESSPALADNPLDYGRVNTAVSAEALDRLSKDVIAREAARKKFSRSKVGENSGDIDYINEKNRQFNKKLRHAFDKYTVEIRQNLERGTAL